MNHRELAVALAALPEGSVGALVEAAASIRRSEEVLAGFNAKKPRKKRGPNKPKVEAPAPVEAPKPTRGRKPAPKPLASAIDRLRAVKAGGIKTRKQVLPDDED